MKLTIKILALCMVLMLALTACTKKEPDAPVESAEPSFEVVTETPGLTPALPLETPQPLSVEVVETGDDTAIEEMLLTGEPDVDYNADLKTTFVHITAQNITKGTVRGSVLVEVRDGETVVATAPAEIEDGSEEDAIKEGETVELFAEFEGKDYSGHGIYIVQNPENPLQPVT